MVLHFVFRLAYLLHVVQQVHHVHVELAVFGHVGQWCWVLGSDGVLELRVGKGIHEYH